MLYSEMGITFASENWKIQPTLRISNINQKYKDIIDPINKSKNSLIFIPNLNISYLLNNKSTFKISGNYEEKTPNEENLFTNFIAQNNRFIKLNQFNLELQQNQNYILSYRFNDLFTSFATNFTLIYDIKKNTYLSSVEIQNDFTAYNFFQLPTNIENYYLN